MPVWPAAGSSSLAFADPGSDAFTVAGTLAGSDAAVSARPIAVPPFNGVFYRAFAVAIIRRSGFNRRDDYLRGHGLWSRLRRRSLKHGFDGRRFRRFLASRRQDWLLADRRNGDLQMRLAAARDFRSRTRLPQTAATATASGSRAHQEHKMRFLVNRIIERGRLDAARRQPDRQKHERGMREERQEDRLAAGARRAVARRKQRFGRLRVERQRSLLQAPRGARGVVHADESGAGNETQFAAAKQCTDGLLTSRADHDGWCGHRLRGRRRL